MNQISRRTFLLSGAASGAIGLGGWQAFSAHQNWSTDTGIQSFSRTPATHAVIPVVSDGKYILDKPPADSDGYFYPRPIRGQCWDVFYWHR